MRDPRSNKRDHSSTSPKYHVQYFEEWHEEELIAMWRRSFEHGVGVIDPHPVAEQRAYFRTKVLPSNTVRVVVKNSHLVGFIAYNEHEISQLYVDVEYSRMGIGSMLVREAKDQSAGSLRLYTFARNAGARAIYERHGFSIIKRGYEEEWGLDDLLYEWKREG